MRTVLNQADMAPINRVIVRNYVSKYQYVSLPHELEIIKISAAFLHAGPKCVPAQARALFYSGDQVVGCLLLSH
jgi:hypothetical protein